MEMCKRTREGSQGPQGAVSNFTRSSNQIYKHKQNNKKLNNKNKIKTPKPNNMYLSNVIDPNTAFWVPNGNFFATLSPTNTV